MPALMPKLPPMSAGTCSRSRDAGTPSAPASTGTMLNGPWKFTQASTAGPSAVSAQFATTQ
jgi:hypothetical protein